MYIYKFTLKETDRCYIGQTIQDPNRRRLEHLSHSYRSSYSYHFHNALRKYGIENFIFEVIATADTIEELNLLEDKFIVEFDSIKNGFNIRTGGGNKTHHADSIKRMQESQRAAHARRRAEGKDGGWTRKDGGPMKGKSHPKKGKPSTKWTDEAKAAHKIRMQAIANRKKLSKEVI